MSDDLVLLTKEELKERWKNLRARYLAQKGDELSAQLGLADFIASNVHIAKKVRSGEDYISHPMHIASKFESKNKKIIAILHDVIEDSDWTIDDLREVGFSDRIIRGVDGVTKRKGEPYFDFIVRCAMSGEDAIDIKIEDLKHNSEETRYRTVSQTAKQAKKRHVYNIAFNYLIDTKKKRSEGGHYNYPATPMAHYMQTREEFAKAPITINALLAEFSSEKERLPTAKITQLAARAFGWELVCAGRELYLDAKDLVLG